MKLIQRRGIKMLLHLVSIFVFSIPITTHILKIALEKEFIIGEHSFTKSDSRWLIGIILFIVSANITSVIADKWHKISFLITGCFLFALTVIQIGVWKWNIPMEVFGEDWSHLAQTEILITGTIGIVLLLSSVFVEDSDLSQKGIFSLEPSPTELSQDIRRFLSKVRRMDRKLAFLLGIVCSLLLAIPICSIMYLVAHVLLENSTESDLFLSTEKLKFIGWLGIVGMQGSIISMLLNLRRFDEKVSNIDSLGLFINSLVRPFIGLSFAHLSFFMIESGLLQAGLQDGSSVNPNDVAEDTKLLYSFGYHVSIAFIAGFTERIAKVIQPNGGDEKKLQPTTKSNGEVETTKNNSNNKKPSRKNH